MTLRTQASVRLFARISGAASPGRRARGQAGRILFAGVAAGCLAGPTVALSNPINGDCNGNGVPDSLDIAFQISRDQNNDGVPDECQTGAVFFTHDLGTAGVAAPPGNAMRTCPDMADVFTSTAAPGSAPGQNVGNALLVNSLDIGLMPGDNIDALHIPRPGLRAPVRNFLFSVDEAAIGASGTAVNLQTVRPADVYATAGGSTNTLSIDQSQLGFAPIDDDELNGLSLSGPNFAPPGTRIFFSLKASSPTLFMIGANEADILTAVVGQRGSLVVSITGEQLGICPTGVPVCRAELDALLMAGGNDANGDGDFNDPGDVMPSVYFSVDSNTPGVRGTAVQTQWQNGSAAGDIFASRGGGMNNLVFDNAAIGLQDTDNLDALETILQLVNNRPPGG